MDMLGLKAIARTNELAMQQMGALAQFFASGVAKPNQNIRVVGGTVVYGANDASGNIHTYSNVHQVYAIIRKISKKCRQIPLYEYAVKDKKAYAAYTIKSKKLPKVENAHEWRSEMADLQSKALELVGETGKLQQLLDKPNSYQSKDEFYDGAYSFMLMNGNRYIFIDTLLTGNKDPGQLILLPPNYTSPRVTQTFPHSVIDYEFRMQGVEVLKTENVIHSKYFNPNYDIMGNELIGLSPLSIAHGLTSRAKSEDEYSTGMFQNSGAFGAVSAADIDGNDYKAVESFGQAKDKWFREMSGTKHAGKIGWFNTKLEYVKFGLSPVDMQLIEGKKMTLKELCNVWGVSDILFNNSDAGTDNIVKHMVKDMIINVALPEVQGLRDALNKELRPRFNTTNIIDYDITDITELQEDSSEIVKRFSSMPVFRPNDMFEALGYGRVDDDENMEKVYIKSGYSAIDDMQTVEPLPNTANDYTNEPK